MTTILNLLAGWPAIVTAVVITQLLALYFVYVLVADVQTPLSRPIPCSRFLVVTAHPDDECMFFGPFIASEVEHSSEVHLLCLCRGNYRGNGEIRVIELTQAIERLGVPVKQVTVLDWPQFPDSPTAKWKINDIRDVILDYCTNKPHIEAIVTFDRFGVSGHANHVAVSEAICSLSKDAEFIPRVFVLETVSVLRKYCRVIDEVWNMKWPSEYRYRLDDELESRVQWALVAHVTQMVWFRQLYRRFSRYMRFNTFVEVNKKNTAKLSD